MKVFMSAFLNIYSTHGVNNVNFVRLDIFGYKFSPRYAKFKKVFNDQFEVFSGDELNIRLKKIINTRLIGQKWNKIQHIIFYLAEKKQKNYINQRIARQ
jgi:hypothetical protein